MMKGMTTKQAAEWRSPWGPRLEEAVRASGHECWREEHDDEEILVVSCPVSFSDEGWVCIGYREFEGEPGYWQGTVGVGEAAGGIWDFTELPALPSTGELLACVQRMLKSQGDI
jgi:hypothetical protein